MKFFHPAKIRIEVSVGESVRILRELQELSQSQLAERSGIPQSTISAIENGRVNLGVERAKMLARAQHPAQQAGVPGGYGGSERRIRACCNAGFANHSIRVTQVADYKHICASW